MIEDYSITDSDRIREIAISKHPNGKMIVATFKLHNAVKMIHYLTPRDIPEYILDGFGAKFKLFHVEEDKDFEKKKMEKT